MTRVDFYVIEAAAGDKARVACRLSEKAFRQGLPVYVHTTSASQAQALDALLWSYRAGSFVPHARIGDALDEVPVLIGHDHEPHGHEGLLINLSDAVPDFFSRFARVAELVDEAARDAARERFRYYRERGYTLETHTLAAER
jgi:DNA polymerase-3 subunit chi